MAAEWAAFLRYRRLLRKLGAEDEPGLAAGPPGGYSSARLLRWRLSPRSPSSTGNRRRRPTGGCSTMPCGRARSVRVTMAWEGDEASASLYEATAPIRDRLLEQGFVEMPVRPGDLAARRPSRARAGAVPPS